jgi:hypothetical protein
VPGRLTPRLHEGLVRLGTWVPFAPAARLLTYFTGVAVSASTAQRQTEAAGAAYVAVQTAEVERLGRELPGPPPGPPVQQLTVDGAFVPLVGGAWAEVKTLSLGTAQPPVWSAREQAWLVHTTDLSYFSRLAEHETFGWQATVETHRRGTESAGVVCAVADGADWCQAFVDLHRPDAVRILDFPHAVGYLAQAAQAVWGTGSAGATTWTREQAHILLAHGPQPVLTALRSLGDAAAVTTALGYLSKRVEQLQYPAFRAAGYPIGSGCGESANKLVVEARLKGSGMHWACRQVDALLALRTVACSDRWAEAWPAVQVELVRRQRQRTTDRRRARQLPCAPPAPTDGPVADPPALVPVAAGPPRYLATASDTDEPVGSSGLTRAFGQHRPAPDHPWRRHRIGRGVPFPRRAEA